MPDTTQGVKTQAKIVIQSMKSKIAQAITAKLESVKSLNYISFDRVKLLASDFHEYELPAVQLIDVALSNEHEQLRAKKFWQIALELVMKGSQHGGVSQEDLWNLEYEILRRLWSVPNLGIKGVIHMKFLSSSTDLHILDPYYTARLDFEVQFYEDMVREC